MGILTRLLEPKAATFGPLDDFWYRDVGVQSSAGVRITPQVALTISTVYACVRIISGTLAMLPLAVFQRLPDGGKERAPQHPLYDVVHTRPNVRQSSFQFREMLMGHALLWGNGYAQIVPGQRGFADQLVPLHPGRVTPTLADDGTIHYEYRPPVGRTEVLLQDEVFHIPGFSDDGIQGLGLALIGKDSFGLTKAAEEFSAESFSEDQTPTGVLKMPGKLGQEGHDRLRQDWRDLHRGKRNIAILEDGLEWQTMGMTNEDAQHLETRLFQVEEVASWFGVPLSLLQHTEKSTSWGTGIAQLTLGFINFTMQPWFTRWEQEISNDLILNKDRFFAEFVVEGLLKGDPATRSAFYQIMVEIGAFTRNEVRVLENMNKLPGLDEPVTVVPPQPPALPPGNALARSMVMDAAGRLVRQETQAMGKAVARAVGEGDVELLGQSFWSGQVEVICKVLHVDSVEAQEYVGRCQALSLKELEDTAEERETELASMALGCPVDEFLIEPVGQRTVIHKKVVRDRQQRITEVIETTEVVG